MNKIIVSSSNLLNKLVQSRFVFDKNYEVEANNRIMDIEGLETAIPVENKNRFILQVSGKSLNNLIKFLRAIPDQPITLGFNENSSWIYVCEASL